MSIRNRPPHVITVYPVVQVDDGYGGTMPGEGAPVDVRVLVVPRSASDGNGTGSVDASEGYLVQSVFSVYAKSLPAGVWSRVVYGGEDYVVVSEPKRYGASSRTSHDVAMIRRR